MLWFLRLFGRFREMEMRAAEGPRLRSILDKQEAELIVAVGSKQSQTRLYDQASRESQRLSVEFQRLTTEKTILQDRLEAAIDDRAKLFALVEKSWTNERVAYQAHVNATWQGRGWGTPYPESPSPAHPQPPEHGTVPRSALPSEAIAARTREFIDEFQGRIVRSMA